MLLLPYCVVSLPPPPLLFIPSHVRQSIHTLHITMTPRSYTAFDTLRRLPLMLGDPDSLPARMENDSSEDASSCPSYTLDSIAMKRRHGEYFHRPPVWFPRPCSYATSSKTSQSDDGRSEKALEQICPSCSAGLDCHCSRRFPAFLPGLFNERECFDRLPDWDPSAPTLGDGLDMRRVSTHESHERNENSAVDIGLSGLYHIATRLPPEAVIEDNLLYQRKVAMCTRLQICRDIRCPPDEQRAMQEGSLVVGIQPGYVGVIPDSDEFELQFGRFYVIIQMYADLWALCVDVSLSVDNYDPNERPMTLSLGFLPLCAVTLPANLNRFLQRCSGREPLCPWNGQTVVPPKRSHSLKTMTEMLQPGYTLRLQTMAENIFGNISALGDTGDDFVPLDSPLKELVSKMADGPSGPLWLRRMLSAKRQRNKTRDRRVASSAWRGLPDRVIIRDTMYFEATSKSSRAEEGFQSERQTRIEGAYHALSHGVGRLLGVSRSEKHV